MYFVSTYAGSLGSAGEHAVRTKGDNLWASHQMGSGHGGSAMDVPHIKKKSLSVSDWAGRPHAS